MEWLPIQLKISYAKGIDQEPDFLDSRGRLRKASFRILACNNNSVGKMKLNAANVMFVLELPVIGRKSV